MNKAGDLSLSLAKGTAKLQRLRWSNNRKYFDLGASGTSELSIPQGMSMSMDKDSNFRMSLPLTIKLGSAKMNSSAGTFILDSLSGKILVNIDKEIALKGDMDFCLRTTAFMGWQKIAVKVHGFNLLANRNQAVAHLTNCIVVIANKDLQNSLQTQLASDKILTIDKTIFEKRRWRYKNAAIKTVTLQNLTLDKLSVDTTNTAKFTVSSAATVDGTIDKGKLTVIIKDSKNYQSKPWQIKAKCLGDGVLKFSFIPGTNLNNSELAYDLSMNLPIPDNVNLDWSQVEKGLYGGIEHSVILSVLKTINSIPIKYHGEKKLFANNNGQFNSINVSSLTTKQIPAGVQLSFVANATF